jgi:hypothetical protein
MPALIESDYDITYFNKKLMFNSQVVHFDKAMTKPRMTSIVIYSVCFEKINNLDKQIRHLYTESSYSKKGRQIKKCLLS